LLEAVAGAFGVVMLGLALSEHTSLIGEDLLTTTMYFTGVPALGCGVQLMRARRWVLWPSLALSLVVGFLLASKASEECGHLHSGEVFPAALQAGNLFQLGLLLVGRRAFVKVYPFDVTRSWRI